MKFLFLSSMCVVLLAACSMPTSTGTATPLTQTELPISTQAQLPAVQTSTSTESPTVTLAGLKYCVVPNLLNLRSGPGINYSIVVIEGQGSCFQVTARNEDSSWVFINTGKYAGWAYLKYLAGEGDISSLPLFAELTLTPQAATAIPSPSLTATP
jgi:uncharacterized protein YgiM (DUF1202 family)